MTDGKKLFDTLDAAVQEAVTACVKCSWPPYDRLPKEELIRSACYKKCSERGTVFVESRYFDVDTDPDDDECDLWLAKCDLWGETWMEIKRAWGRTGWVNKPGEQEQSWLHDVAKLRVAEPGHRAFLLVTFQEPGYTNLENSYRRVAKKLDVEALQGEAFRIGWRGTEFDVQSRLWWWQCG